MVRRLIHTTADFEFLQNTRFHPQAVAAGIAAIRSGVAIFTDTRMAQAGITRRHLAQFGCEVHCYIDDSEVVTVAKRENITRAAAAVSQARELLHGGLAVIGNAPTALIELVRLHKQGILQPNLVVGMPVGFVNAAEAKELLMASGLVYISVRGRKGGSAVAAADCQCHLLTWQRKSEQMETLSTKFHELISIMLQVSHLALKVRHYASVSVTL